MKSLVVTLLCLASTTAFGQDYRCTIREVTGADTSSGFVKVGKMLIGRQFTVDRRTGIMVGALKNSYVSQPQVIDPGSKENSFKVVTTAPKTPSRPGSNFFALNIDEWYTTSKKPFVFLETQTVYLGDCEHF
jgi:hypothetical protein